MSMSWKEFLDRIGASYVRFRGPNRIAGSCIGDVVETSMLIACQSKRSGVFDQLIG
jgi:hypothetical protein